LDTRFGGYKACYRAAPKHAATRIDFENIERRNHNCSPVFLRGTFCTNIVPPDLGRIPGAHNGINFQEGFRAPRPNTTVMSTPIAAPNAIHFPMLFVAAPTAAPIAMPRAIPILITIPVSPAGVFLPIFASPVCPI
jgi:hypothetical protein